MDAEAMTKLSYGLFMLSARENGRDNGCIVNTVTQVTATPNRITVAVNKKNFTHDMILRTKEFNVSILTESSQFSTYKHWGMQSGATVDKLVDTKVCRSANGLIYLSDECNAYLSAKVVSAIDVGTHTLFLADVTEAATLSDEPSVTYAYYQAHIKTTAKQKPKSGFVCTVCGYIYEGEVLPPDFVCPWCKHPASDFKPIDR